MTRWSADAIVRMSFAVGAIVGFMVGGTLVYLAAALWLVGRCR